MVQKAFQENGRRKRGEITARGRQHQVESRLTHGIKYQSPVLPDVESEQMWETHLAGIRESLAPVGTFEEALVHKIAFQLWRADRLIRHETDLVHSQIVNPNRPFGEEADKDTVQVVITTPRQQLNSELAASEELISRYEAIGSEASDVVFSPAEVREFLESILEHVEGREQFDDDDEPEELDSQEEELDIEDRSWTAAEVAEQIKLFASQAGVDWREEFDWALYKERQAISNRREALVTARQHVARKLIPSQDDVVRLGVYERQILAAFKHYLNALQRAQALRLGQPVAAPIALDVTVSDNDHLPE
jgi:hypothetical protein